MGCHKYPNPFQHLVTYPRWRRHPENGEEYLWASHTRNEENGQPNTCVHQSPSPLSSLNITILLVLWWFLFPFHNRILVLATLGINYKVIPLTAYCIPTAYCILTVYEEGNVPESMRYKWVWYSYCFFFLPQGIRCLVGVILQYTNRGGSVI